VSGGQRNAVPFRRAITPERANYDGNYPYAGGSKGKNRKTTVPVKSFPPNDWGLYEMHGNVWEWCADGKRTYDGTEQENPRGLEGLAPRVVRGGSWFNDARNARSAYRLAYTPDFANLLYGFRFALRSTRQEQEASRVTRDA